MEINKTAVKIVLNKKTFILAFLALSVIIIGISYFINNSTSNSRKACISDKACFNVEIADTLSEREMGLSGRDSMDNNSGMLFIFQEEEMPGFWMKDMKFSLDIIWIDSDLKIVGIEKNLQPCQAIENCPVFYPDKKIMYVLEINFGLSDDFGFEKNDSVYF